jgi:hypothetical protein
MDDAKKAGELKRLADEVPEKLIDETVEWIRAHCL